MRPVTHIHSHRKFKSKADRAFDRFLAAWGKGLISTEAGPLELEPIIVELKRDNVLRMEMKHVAE